MSHEQNWVYWILLLLLASSVSLDLVSSSTRVPPVKSQKRLFEGDKIANMVVDMEVAKVVDMVVVEMELDKVADKVANKEADLMVDMARWSVLD